MANPSFPTIKEVRAVCAELKSFFRSLPLKQRVRLPDGGISLVVGSDGHGNWDWQAGEPISEGDVSSFEFTASGLVNTNTICEDVAKAILDGLRLAWFSQNSHTQETALGAVLLEDLSALPDVPILDQRFRGKWTADFNNNHKSL
jgi:hypothetical protein